MTDALFSFDADTPRDRGADVCDGIDSIAATLPGRVGDHIVVFSGAPIVSATPSMFSSRPDIAAAVEVDLRHRHTGAWDGGVRISLTSMPDFDDGDARFLRIALITEAIEPDRIDAPAVAALVDWAVGAHRGLAGTLDRSWITTEDPRAAERLSRQVGVSMIGPEIPGGDPAMSDGNDEFRALPGHIAEAVERRDDPDLRRALDAVPGGIDGLRALAESLAREVAGTSRWIARFRHERDDPT